MDKSTSDIDIPPNWQIFMEGKFPVGYLSGDTDFGDSPPSPCGNKTHTHSSGSAFGAAGSGLAVAKHLPPYQIVKFIQRVPGIV
jgi:hypothetical protein